MPAGIAYGLTEGSPVMTQTSTDDPIEMRVSTVGQRLPGIEVRIVNPEVKEVFRLGNHLVWVAPSGAALVIDTTDGKDKLSDAEIDKLFVDPDLLRSGVGRALYEGRFSLEEALGSLEA